MVHGTHPTYWPGTRSLITSSTCLGAKPVDFLEVVKLWDIPRPLRDAVIGILPRRNASRKMNIGAVIASYITSSNRCSPVLLLLCPSEDKRLGATWARFPAGQGSYNGQL